MPEFASDAGELTDGDASRGLARRRFLTFLVTAPALTVAARVGAEVLTPARADAVVPSPPQPADVADFGDVMTALTRADTDLFVLQVSPDNRIRFEVPRAEVGQGITTALAMIVAEELDARLADVDVPLSDARQDLGAAQSTGGSTSVRSLWDPVRQLAAAARARLVTAAAQEWNVPATTLSTHDTAVWAPDGRTATYGSLTAAAARVLIPAVSSDPKPAAAYARSRSANRPGGRAGHRDRKGAVRARRRGDGALPTVVARPPTINGAVLSYDATVARSMPGVVAVTQIPTGVAVTAETFDQAMKAVAGAGGQLGCRQRRWRVRRRRHGQAHLGDRAVRGAAAAGPVRGGRRSISRSSTTPRWRSAARSPTCGPARPRSGWRPSRRPAPQSAVAGAVGLQTGQVTVHVVRGGGSFGRRIYFRPRRRSGPGVEGDRPAGEADVDPQRRHAARPDAPAQPSPDPGHLRRGQRGQLRAPDGQRRGRFHRQRHRPGAGRRGLRQPRRSGPRYFQLSEACPYNFGAVTETLAEVPYDVPTGPGGRSTPRRRARPRKSWSTSWPAAWARPLAFRLDFLKTDAERAVLNKVAVGRQLGTADGTTHRAGRRLPRRVPVAGRVPGRNRLHHLDTARDEGGRGAGRGAAGQPEGLQAQAMGSVIDGISTILSAGNHLDNGAFREGSYKDFLYARQANAPLSCDVYVMPATQPSPGGAGELIVPTAAAAVANAYARATGTKPRSFPITF